MTAAQVSRYLTPADGWRILAAGESVCGEGFNLFVFTVDWDEKWAEGAETEFITRWKNDLLVSRRLEKNPIIIGD